MLNPQQQRELVLAHQRQVGQVRERVDRLSFAAWAALAAYRAPDIGRLVDIMIPRIAAAQWTVATLTDAYLARLAGVRPAGIDRDLVSGALPRRGVDPDVVYSRPGGVVYKALADGKPLADAAIAGQQRLQSIARTDLQLGMRQQEQASLTRYGFEYWTRILTGDENCALCILASTRRYLTGDLKAIHPGCDCTVSGANRVESDPGVVLNAQRVEELHALLGGDTDENLSGRGVVFEDGTKRDYKDVLVREHGELGPTLTWRHHDFTGPDGEKTAGRGVRDRSEPGGFDSLTPDQLRRQLATIEPLKDSEWRTAHIARVRARLAEL